MNQKKISKREVKKLTHMVKEVSLQVPFTTNVQEEVQRIVKELWENKKTFETIHDVTWLNEQIIKIENSLPAIMLYSKVEKNENMTYVLDDEDYKKNGFNIKIMNMEYHSPYEQKMINILGTDNDDLKGISLVAIMNSLYYDFCNILDLHKKIIEIYKSNLDEKNKKYCISSVINEINTYIEDNKNKFNFIYPYEVIRDLNDLYLYYPEWIKEGDSYIVEIALEAYREITYYSYWLKKNNVEGKHFKDKIYALNKSYREIIDYFDMEAPYKRVVPQHPQDILYGLVDRYIDAYGDKRNVNDDGVQAIIRIISDYQRMPKKSKSKKEMEIYSNETCKMVEAMKQKGALNEEIHSFIIDRAFGKFVTYVGDQETE